MIQMVRHINGDWKSHVANTGVTCYTCHRGNPVPMNTWHSEPAGASAGGAAQFVPDQNHPSRLVGSTSLPADPYSSFLERQDDIRIVSNTALPEGNRSSIKQAEYTYGLMMSMSQALGQNCTFCHNTRSFPTLGSEQSATRAGLARHPHGSRFERELSAEAGLARQSARAMGTC